MYTFIPCVSDEDRQRLREHRVPFRPFECDEEAGILIEDRVTDQLCTVLSVGLGDAYDSPFDGIVVREVEVTVEVTGDRREGGFSRWCDSIVASFYRRGSRISPSLPEYQDRSRSCEVTVVDWKGFDSRGYVGRAQQHLSSSIMTPVVLHGRRGEAASPLDDGKFHIWLWCAAAGEPSRRSVPREAWNVRSEINAPGFEPTGSGVVITSPEGFAVAELVGNNLYILHDLFCDNSKSRRRLFGKVLDAACAEYLLSDDVRRERAEKAAREAYDQGREHFVIACRGRVREEVKRLRKIVSEGQEKTKALQAELQRAHNDLALHREMLERLQPNEYALDDQFKREYDSLLSLEGVRYVMVNDKEIRIFTDTIYCSVPETGLTYELGEYEIVFKTKDGDGAPLWFNRTGLRPGGDGGMHHPHVRRDGSACLGNVTTAFPMLLGSYRYRDAAILAIEFLKSVNVRDGWGRHITSWPLARPTTVSQ